MTKRKRICILPVQLTKLKLKKIEVVAEEIGDRDVRFVFTGVVDGGRGLLGDMKIMLLSIGKLMKTGWKPKYTSEQAVKLAVKAILEER